MSSDLPASASEGHRCDKRSYYHLLAAQVIALLSTGLATVALALLAYKQVGTDAAAILGTALSIRMIAYVAFAPIVTTLTEHLPRRQLLVSLELVRATVALSLHFVTQEWEVYVLIFLFQAAAAGYIPAVQATYPDLLPDEEEYTKALAKSRLAQELENVVSPLLAAALLFVIDFSDLFVGTAIGFLVSAALIARTRLPRRPFCGREGEERAGIYQRIFHGFRLFWHDRRLRGVLAINFATAAAVAMVVVNTVVAVQSGFSLGDRATGIALGAFGAGAVACALALPWLLRRLSDRSAMLMGAAMVTTGLAFGTAVPNYTLLVLLWVGLGLGVALGQLPAARVLRRSTGSGDRPALYATYFALTHACLMIAYPLAGWLGAAAGLRLACTILAILAGLATLAAASVWPRHDLTGIVRAA